MSPIEAGLQSLSTEHYDGMAREGEGGARGAGGCGECGGEGGVTGPSRKSWGRLGGTEVQFRHAPRPPEHM